MQKETYGLLRTLNENDCLKRRYRNTSLTQTNTCLSRIYGFPKIHKEGNPIRPIVSIRDSPTEFMANEIYDSLSKSIKKSKSHIPNSFTFIDKIKNLAILDNYTPISLDVKCQFTNVGLELVLRSIERRYAQISCTWNIPLELLLDSCKFLVRNTFFIFNGKFYKQKYGTPMASPVSGLFADIVMEDLETTCLKKPVLCSSFLLPLCRRYYYLCTK